MKSNLVSVIIATFNSEKTLPMVLMSIRKQTYPQKHIEILIVDGGSKDKTVAITKKFHCKIIHNSKIEPTHAKYLGFIYAKGKYITYIDHDEVLLNPNSIKYKVQVLEKHSSVKAVITSGYKNPEGYPIVNRYINEFGDPFSFFIYHLTKNADFFYTTMRKRYKMLEDTKIYSVFDISSSSKIPLIELGAAGGMIERSFIKKEFNEIIKKYKYIPSELSSHYPLYPYIAVIKNDAILHFSSENFYGYINKIIWRVKNNIFYSVSIDTPAFSRRESHQPSGFQFKKYLFLPYAFSLIFPSIDALYLIVTRKDISYIIHIPLTLLTASLIVYYSMLKFFNIDQVLTSYDGSKVIYGKK